MTKIWISVIIVLLVIARVKTNAEIELEAENGVEIFNGTVMDRTRASNQKTVRLTDSGYVVNTFETAFICRVTVSNVAYTNNGSSDNVTVSIDDERIGSFETVAVNSDYWEFVQNSTSLGGREFEAGSHRLRLEIDGPAVEIDKTTLTLACDDDDDDPSTDGVDDNDVVLGLDAGQVAGISVGVAVVIAGAIGCIIACYTKCCGACKHDYDL